MIMRKNLQPKQSAISMENNHPGCMWGVLHVLKYHRWRHFTKRLPYRKGSRGSSSNSRHGHDHDHTRNEIPGNDHVESTTERKNEGYNVRNTVDEEMKQSGSVSKGSVKSRFKALISEEFLKRKPHHRRTSTYPVRIPLPRTDSFHRLEQQNKEISIAEDRDSLNHFSPRSSDEQQSLAKAHELSRQNSVSENDKELTNNKYLDCSDDKMKNVMNENERNVDATGTQSKELLDAFKMINMNKELFVRLLQDPSSPLACRFNNNQAIRARVGFAKSTSFPSPIPSYKQGSDPSKIRQKKEKVDSDATELDIPEDMKPKKFARIQSMPLIAAEYRADGILKLNQSMTEATDNSIPSSSSPMNNRVTIKRFKDLKNKVKQAIKESKHEKHRITMDAILHKVPHRHGFSRDLRKEIVDQIRDRYSILDREGKESQVSNYDSDHSLPSTSKSERRSISRTTSLNESLDRYCQLYESTFSRETKQHNAASPKTRTEDAVTSPQPRSSKYIARNFSSPEFQSYYTEYSFDPSDLEKKVIQETTSRSNEQHKQDSEHLLPLDVHSQVRNDSPYIAEAQSMVSDLHRETKTGLNEEDPGSLVIHVEEDTEPRFELAEAEHEAPVLEHEKEDFPSKSIYAEMLASQVNTKDKAEFDYVRDILELSGFSGTELLGTRHLNDQPVSPSIFEEVEDCCVVMDPDCSGNEEGGHCHHLLLFDLINQVLMEIYAKSHACCPVPLSSLSRIHPMPVGSQVLEEVWTEISWYLTIMSPEDDLLLYYLTSRDLSRNDGWMNLQFDTECVGIELEDLILEDLLDELDFS